MKSFICLLLGFMFFGDSCCSNGKCDKRYTFEFPIAIYPRADSLKLGDTISIVSTFSNQIYDRRNNAFYKLHDTKFSPVFGLSNIDGDREVGLIEDSTLIISPEYDYRIIYHSDGDRTLSTEYLYDGNEYKLEFKVILKKKGLCFMQIGAFGGDSFTNTPMFLEKQCRESYVSWYYKLENEADNNIEFIQNAKDPYLRKFKDAEYYNRVGGYCFVVTD